MNFINTPMVSFLLVTWLENDPFIFDLLLDGLILITNLTIISYNQTFGCYKSRINLPHLLKYGNLHKHQLLENMWQPSYYEQCD